MTHLGKIRRFHGPWLAPAFLASEVSSPIGTRNYQGTNRECKFPVNVLPWSWAGQIGACRAATEIRPLASVGTSLRHSSTLHRGNRKSSPEKGVTFNMYGDSIKTSKLSRQHLLEPCGWRGSRTPTEMC